MWILVYITEEIVNDFYLVRKGLKAKLSNISDSFFIKPNRTETFY